MHLNRRQLLAGATVAGVAAAGFDAFPRRALAATATALTGADTAGTTLAATLLRGPAGAGGFRRHVVGPGEPHLLREDLGVRAKPGREGRRRGLLAFAQLTDVHLIDVQSPARVEYLDRYDDRSAPGPGLFSSAYRPHEMLTVQVADSLATAVRDIGRGPLTGLPLAFTVVTGDITDNCHHNELRWAVDLLDGQPVRPDSGDLTRFEGVADAAPTSYDVHYWHPGGTPAAAVDPVADEPRRLAGFPLVPDLLDAVRRPFRAGGLGMPWFTVYGNHDGLVQGNFPQSFQLSTLSTGSLKVVSLPAGASQSDVVAGLKAGDPATAAALLAGPARTVTPDANRRIVSRREVVEAHFDTAGTPVGHGFTAANRRAATAYYGADVGPGGLVRMLVLDTVNPNGEADGSLDGVQLAWLERELAAASRQRLDSAGRLVAAGGRDRLVMVVSHHPVRTLTNPIVSVDSPAPRVLGPAVLALLLSFPNVVVWVNGHTHVNEIVGHMRPAGSVAPGGFWEVSTAAHVDWPVQARLVELVDNRDGTLSIVGTIIDAAAPAIWPGRTDSPALLASLARELALNDPQERGVLVTATRDGRRGQLTDRNVELMVAAPFSLEAASAAAAAGAGTTGSDTTASQAGAGALATTGPAPWLGVAATAGLVAAAGVRRWRERDAAGG